MAQLDEGGVVGERPRERPEDRVALGPADLTIQNPHIARAQLAANRARLQAERVRAWKKRHAEVFEQLRVRPDLDPSPFPATERKGHVGSDSTPPESAEAVIQTRSEQPAPGGLRPDVVGEGRGSWKPEARRRARVRPSYERTKAALAENLLFDVTLLEDVRECSNPASFWRDLMRRFFGRASPAPRPSPRSGRRLAAAPACREPRRSAPVRHARIGAATRAPHLDNPPLLVPFPRGEGAALLQACLGRVRARLQPPMGDQPGPSLTGAHHLPILVDSGPTIGNDRAAQDGLLIPTGRRQYWTRELWFVAAVGIAAFSCVAIPYVLSERGVISPARVGNALSLPAEGFFSGADDSRGDAAAQAHTEPWPTPAASDMTSRLTVPQAAAPSEVEKIDGPEDDPVPATAALADGAQEDAPTVPATPDDLDLRSGETWSELYTLGHKLLAAEQPGAAAAAFKGAAELNPDHPAIRYDLGYLFQRTGDIDRAIAQYRMAIELKPDHPYAVYNLGFLLYRKNRFAEAMPYYERAAQLLPDNPYVAFNFAALLERQGEVARARSMFARVLDIDESQQIATDARARLARLN